MCSEGVESWFDYIPETLKCNDFSVGCIIWFEDKEFLNQVELFESRIDSSERKWIDIGRDSFLDGMEISLK